jgi:hypothetical protein
LQGLSQGLSATDVACLTKPTGAECARPSGVRHPLEMHGLGGGMCLARKACTRQPEPFMDISTISQPRAWQAQRSDLARAALDEEHADLMALLRTHASHPGILADHLAMAIAQACMGSRHLWEDLGLANRGQLQALMAEHFTALHQRNDQNMRWKKFFYRLLCEEAEVPICKSPHCSQCEDQTICFDGAG